MRFSIASLISLVILVGCDRSPERTTTVPYNSTKKQNQSADLAIERLSKHHDQYDFEKDIEIDDTDFWLIELKAIASGERCRTTDAGHNHWLPIARLLASGDESVDLLLGFVHHYCGRDEWGIARPTEEKSEFQSFQDPVIHVLWALQTRDMEKSHETQLLRSLRTALAVNDGDELWGVIPFHLAKTLYVHFDYPEPDIAGNNALVAPEAFVKSGG